MARPEHIERAIHIVRGQRVIVDADLAKLYGVTTAALNQALLATPGELVEQINKHAETVTLAFTNFGAATSCSCGDSTDWEGRFVISSRSSINVSPITRKA